MRFLFVCLAAALVAGCATADGKTASRIDAGVVKDRYCADTTEEGKQALRDRVTGGVKVIKCDEEDGQ